MSKKDFYKDYNLEELWEKGDLDTLYACCENLIHSTYRSYPNLKLDEDEKIELGYISFMKTVKSFNPSKNEKFTTLLVVILRNDILLTFRAERKKLNNNYSEVSLSEVLHANNQGDTLIIEDALQDKNTDIEAEVISKNNVEYILSTLKTLLSETQYEALMTYIHSGIPQRDISKMYGKSPNYINRLLKLTQRKLIKKGLYGKIRT